MVAYSPYQHGVLDERERIAKFLETHSIDWDCSLLWYDKSDYDPSYCEAETEYDEYKAKACQRRTLADIVRGIINPI